MSQRQMSTGQSSEPHAGGQRSGWTVTAAATHGMDAAQLWETLYAARRVIFRVALLFFFGVTLVTLASRMEFKSRGRMYLGELDGKPSLASSSAELDLSNGEQSSLASEAQILQSDSLLTRAILASGLNVTIAPEGWRAPRYLQWLLSKSNPQLVDVTAPELLAVNTSLEDNYRGAQTFKVTFTSEKNYELWTKTGPFDLFRGETRLLGKGTLDQAEAFGALKLTLTHGTKRRPRAGSAYAIRVVPLDDVINDVSKNLTVSFPKPIAQGEVTKVVSLEFRHASPHLAAVFLSELMRGYLDAHQSWKVEDATAAEAFVSNQLGVIRESLDKTEKRLADYRSNSGVVVLDNEAQAMIEQVGKYEEQRIAARLQVTSLSEMKRALKDPNARMEAFLMGEGDDTVLTNLAATLSKARQELATLEQRFSSAAPDVRQQRAEVEAQLDTIRNYVSSRLTRAQSNLDALGHVVGQYEQKLKTVPGAELGLAQLARESEVYSKIYSYLLERQQQTAIIKASRVSKNRVLDPPEEPYRVDSPNLRTRALLAGFGLLVGCAFVVLRRVLSSRLQSESELCTNSGRLPVLASIPRAAGPIGECPEFEEAFRMLRISLSQGRDGTAGQVVLVTSPSAGDGKTTTVFELATMLAADGKSALVIDAGLREPTHHLLIGGPQSPGFSDVLARRCDWHHAVRDGIHPHVFSMTAGTEGASELLSSERLELMLSEARAAFNFILLDAPSFPAISDSLTLCAHADCVLSVLRLRNTPRELAAEHINRLSPLAKRYGIVMNDARVAVSRTTRGPRRRKPARALTSAGTAGGAQAPSRPRPASELRDRLDLLKADEAR